MLEQVSAPSSSLHPEHEPTFAGLVIDENDRRVITRWSRLSFDGRARVSKLDAIFPLDLSYGWRRRVLDGRKWANRQLSALGCEERYGKGRSLI